jgi:hypothetical protein
VEGSFSNVSTLKIQASHSDLGGADHTFHQKFDILSKNLLGLRIMHTESAVAVRKFTMPAHIEKLVIRPKELKAFELVCLGLCLERSCRLDTTALLKQVEIWWRDDTVLQDNLGMWTMIQKSAKKEGVNIVFMWQREAYRVLK